MSGISLNPVSTVTSRVTQIEPTAVDILRKVEEVSKNLENYGLQLKQLSERSERENLDLEEILDFQDQLNRDLHFFDDDPARQQIIEEVEALMISVLTTNKTPQKTTAKKTSFHFNPLATFSYAGGHYVVRPTKGEGSCAIHALLGEEIEGLYRFSGPKETSSERAKRHYTDALEQALGGDDPLIQLYYCNALRAYLTNEDLSSAMLFVDTSAGQEIKRGWNQLNSDFEIRVTIQNEGALWLPLVVADKSPLFAHIMDIVAKKEITSRYYGKTSQEVIGILQSDVREIVNFVDEEPVVFTAMVGSERSKIEKIREIREDLRQQLYEKGNAYVLSSTVLNHYIATVNHSHFYLNTDDIHLAAYLFNTPIQVVASAYGSIIPDGDLMNPSGEGEITLIHHQGLHFSRCVKMKDREEENPLGAGSTPASEELSPFILMERETRSHLFCPGEMRIKSFDPKSGEIEAEFLSHEQHVEFKHSIAQSMANNQHYGLAKQIEMEKEQVPLLWIEKGLKETAKQIQNEEGKEWEAVNYVNHAGKIAERLEGKKRDYHEIIAEMKKQLYPLEIEKIPKFLELYAEAVALAPKAFLPHQLRLMLVIAYVVTYPLEAEMIVNQAYKLSPQLTFNILLTYLLMTPKGEGPGAQKGFQMIAQAFAQLFFKRFPYDNVTYLLLSQKKWEGLLHFDVESRRHQYALQFSTLLYEGLELMQRGHYALAREKFSRAEFYHISDKRPYVYKVLIDLNGGDTSSALKLMISLKRLVDWSDGDALSHFNEELTRSLTSDSSSEWSGRDALETPVLKALLDFHMSPKNEHYKQKFMDSVKAYLSDSQADLIWARIAVTMNEMLLGERSYMDLLQTLISSCYARLQNLKVDLSEFNEMIQVEEDKVLITVSLVVTWPSSDPWKLSIDSQSFALSDSTLPLLLKKILWDSYNDFCLFPIREGMDLKKIFSWKIEGETPLHGPFIHALLKRMDAQIKLEERCQFLEWASDHIRIWPEEHKEPLANSIFRWQLQSPILVKKHHHLLDAVAAKFAFSPSNTMQMSYQAWHFLVSKDYLQAAEESTPFFADWENQLSMGVDHIALRTLCLVNVFVKNRKLFEMMPRVALSEYHEQLIGCALTILAREGLKQPYVIPDCEMSQREIRDLCHLFMGRRRNENRDVYFNRLKSIQSLNTSDLRQSKQVSFSSHQPTEGWMIPIKRKHIVDQVKEYIEHEKALEVCSQIHNKKIQGERPEYTNNQPFIRWVNKDKKLISNYIKEPEKTVAEFKKNFSSLPQQAKEKFLEELRKKGEHQKHYSEIEKTTPKPSDSQDERFWQLVAQTAALIERISSGLRNQVSYDMVLETEAEARFVMDLIYEWSWSAWQGEIDQGFVEAFHGPEIHMWGNGPRILHFNAGVYMNGHLENVHLFFKK